MNFEWYSVLAPNGPMSLGTTVTTVFHTGQCSRFPKHRREFSYHDGWGNLPSYAPLVRQPVENQWTTCGDLYTYEYDAQPVGVSFFLKVHLCIFKILPFFSFTRKWEGYCHGFRDSNFFFLLVLQK